MIIQIRQRGRTLFDKVLDPGYQLLGAGLDARLTPSGHVRIGNGVMDGDKVGNVFVDEVIVKESRTSITPRNHWGKGGEVIQSRGSLRLRNPRARPPRAPIDFVFGSRHWSYAPLLRSVSPFADYPPQQTGSYEYVGDLQPDDGGMKGIEPCSGFQGDAAGLIRRMDASCNRMPLDAQWTIGGGIPDPNHLLTLNGHSYSDDRGYAKSTMLTPFCVPASANQYDEHRLPKDWNTGTCAYYGFLLGLDRYNGLTPYNRQHAIRHTRTLIDAAACGDELAWIELDADATDARMAAPGPFMPTSIGVLPPWAGKGSSLHGTRAQTWRVWSWMHAPRYYSVANEAILAMVFAQMPNGGIQDDVNPGSFNPPPSAYGIATNKRVLATMEHFLAMHVLAVAGRLDAVRKGMAGIFNVLPAAFLRTNGVPKFIVTSTNGNVTPVFTEWSVNPALPNSDFAPWIGLGAIAALDPAAADWRVWCCSIPVPTFGRCAHDLTDLRTMLRAWQGGRSQTVALLSVLETVLA